MKNKNWVTDWVTDYNSKKIWIGRNMKKKKPDWEMTKWC